MKEKLFKAVLMLVVLMVLTGLAWSQDAQPNVTLIVNGQSVQIPVVQMNGKSYVDVDALARLTNGSVSLKGNQVISTPAGSAPSTPPARAKAVAQDTPIGPEGTSVATQATPEAAANADELRKAAQNPIASLISVPIQPTWNFGSVRFCCFRTAAWSCAHTRRRLEVKSQAAGV